MCNLLHHPSPLHSTYCVNSSTECRLDPVDCESSFSFLIKHSNI